MGDPEDKKEEDSRPEVRFGQRLREIREQAGVGLRQLGHDEDFQWGAGAISDVETGRYLATQQYVEAFEQRFDQPPGSLEKERVVARNERRALGDAPRERSRRMPAGQETRLGADGDSRRARRKWGVAALVASGCVGALVLVALLQDSGSPPRPAGQAEATRVVEQYIARFRAEDLSAVMATLAPNPRIIDRAQTASVDKTTTTSGREDVRGEYRTTFGIADLSDRRERVVDTRAGADATIVDTEWTDSLDRRNVGPRYQGTTAYEVVSVDGVPLIATVRERALVAAPVSP